MVLSIVLSGLAIGCVYALIGVAYNVMYSASRVFSFTAGTLGMVGSILGSLFILKMGLPIWVGFLLALAGGALLGVVTEILAVRPVLKSLDQHLYVLSTLALALIVQQFAAIEWSTEPQPFPRIFPIERNAFDQQFWLPMLACAVTIVGLEILYRCTLLGHAFLAIAEDNYAARALGLPERNLRMASFAIAGAIGALSGFAGGQMRSLCDACVVVPCDNMQIIEDLQLCVAHSLFTCVRAKLTHSDSSNSAQGPRLVKRIGTR